MSSTSWKHSPKIVICASCGVQEALVGGLRGWLYMMGKPFCSKDACREVANLPPESTEAPDPDWDDEPKREI